VLGLQFAFQPDHQEFPRELIDDREHPDGTAVVDLVRHEIIGPHVIS
jgi:hypothetical protein